jgi:carbon storage regulator
MCFALVFNFCNKEVLTMGKLVLSRKVRERIIVGDRVAVEVVSIKGNTVRIAIEAPKEVKVLRQEIVNLQSDTEGGKTESAE